MAFQGRPPGRDGFSDFEMLDMKALVATRRDIAEQIKSAETKLAKAQKSMSHVETVIEDREKFEEQNQERIEEERKERQDKKFNPPRQM